MAIAATTAHINPNSPRAEEWKRVFGGLEIKIKSPIPIENDSPAGRRKFFLVDVASLTAEQRERVIDHVSARFNLSREDVESDLESGAFPILDEDVTVAFDMRLVL